MAYVSRGFVPQCDLNINTGMTKLFYIPSGDSNATALYDIVKASTSGSTTVNCGLPAGLPGAVRITGIDDVPVGVVVGFIADPSYLEQTYRTASTARVALVCYDPQVVLEAQEDNAGAATLAVSRIGTPVDVSIAAVDTVTGTSSMQIGSGALAGTPGMFRLQQRSFDPSNAAIGGTNTKWLVTFNVHQYKATT
jgi:hypothetical protein